MKPQLVLLAHVVNRAVTEGFIPAAKRLGYNICLVTDHGLAYQQAFVDSDDIPDSLVVTDVFNPLAVIDSLQNHGITADVVFSNSDHLQTSTALVAQFYGCASKDWRVCYQAKNKAAMRQRLNALALPTVWSTRWQLGTPLPEDIPFPVVAKPREGVASMDVCLCEDAHALQSYGAQYARLDNQVLLEAYLEGPLFTLETLGDGKQLMAIGGFDVSLSPLPHFIETKACWNGPIARDYQQQALAQVMAFGVQLGVCHSEFVLTDKGPVLIEINYRSIGDGREFLLDELFAFSWFETILSLHAGADLPTLDIHSPSAAICYFPATKSGTISTSPANFAIDEGNFHARYLGLKPTGDTITLSHSNKDYLGVLTLWGDADKLDAELSDLSSRLKWEITA